MKDTSPNRHKGSSKNLGKVSHINSNWCILLNNDILECVQFEKKKTKKIAVGLGGGVRGGDIDWNSYNPSSTELQLNYNYNCIHFFSGAHFGIWILQTFSVFELLAFQMINVMQNFAKKEKTTNKQQHRKIQYYGNLSKTRKSVKMDSFKRYCDIRHRSHKT